MAGVWFGRIRRYNLGYVYLFALGSTSHVYSCAKRHRRESPPVPTPRIRCIPSIHGDKLVQPSKINERLWSARSLQQFSRVL